MERLKLVVGYVVVAVWSVVFLTGLLIEPRDQTFYLSVQAVMMLVAGGLYADRLIRKKRRDNGE